MTWRLARCLANNLEPDSRIFGQVMMMHRRHHEFDVPANRR